MIGLRRCLLLTVPVVAWTAAPAQAQWVVSPYVGMNVAGDVEHGKGGPGGSVSHLGGRFGFELDFQRYQHFFKDSEVSPLDPAAPPNCTPALAQARVRCTDIDTDALGLMGNVVFLPVRGARKWRPYATAGLGLIRAWTNEEGRHQNDLAIDGGVGLMYWPSAHVGLRGDLRYVGAFVDENNPEGVLFRNYDFFRASLGVTFRFHR